MHKKSTHFNVAKFCFYINFYLFKKINRKINFKKIHLNNFSTKKLKLYKLLQKTFNRIFFNLFQFKIHILHRYRRFQKTQNRRYNLLFQF